MKKDLHQVQASILRELLFHNGTNFASLNKTGIPNDHFTFHIKQLIKGGIVEKSGKLYCLTQAGKLYANKLDIFKLKMEQFGTPSVAITATKIIKGEIHYLIQQRLKEPLYGYYGFINGKVKFGEFAEETAARELLEETGLIGKPKILAVQHRLRGPSRDNIKLDHYFFICIIDNPKGKIKDTEEGKNYWKTKKEIDKLRTFPGFNHSLKVATKGKPVPYEEMFIKVENI